MTKKTAPTSRNASTEDREVQEETLANDESNASGLESNRDELEENGAVTSHKEKTRVKMLITAGTATRKIPMKKIYQDIVNQLHSIDSTCYILPWDEALTKEKNPITSVETIPTTFDSSDFYCVRGEPQLKGQQNKLQLFLHFRIQSEQ